LVEYCGRAKVPDTQNAWYRMSPNDTTGSVVKTGNFNFPLKTPRLCASARDLFEIS